MSTICATSPPNSGPCSTGTATEQELIDRARELSAMIGNAVDVAHYGNEQRELLRRGLADTLIMEYRVKMPVATAVADELISLAARNRDWFVRLVRS